MHITWKYVITINIKIYASITIIQRFSNVNRLNQCLGCTLCHIHTIIPLKRDLGIVLHVSSNKNDK